MNKLTSNSPVNVLIVCSGNTPDFNLRLHQPFVVEQIETLAGKHNVNYDFFVIKGKGFKGYLSNLLPLYKILQQGKFNLVHAHFGLSGLLAVLQRSVPVIITFHGSDFNIGVNRLLSLVARNLAAASIFVVSKMAYQLHLTTKDFIIPCGVDLELFYPLDKEESRKKLGLEQSKKYILFPSAFSNTVKNYPLAKSAVESLGSEFELLELKSRSREEVNLLLNSVDLLLMTSYSEGSPQIIKEAMACNCPIVSVDVGDVKEVLAGVNRCYIVPAEVDQIQLAINSVLSDNGLIFGREKIKSYDNTEIVDKVYNVYLKVLEYDL